MSGSGEKSENTERSKTGLIRKYFLIAFFLFMSIYRAFIFVGFRGTNCPSIGITPTSSCEWFNVTFELMLWGIVAVLFILELIWDHGFKPFFSFCVRFWPVFAFVLLAFLSLIWSILPQITLYKISVLIICTLLAIYTGFSMGNDRFLNVLTWFLTVVILVNLIFIPIFPAASMWGGPDLWNGMFWHKIYMGAFLVLAITIYLLKLLNWKKLSFFARGLNVSMLLVAIVLLFKSGSVTGLISAVVMAAVCLIFAGWIRWGKFLKPVHYFAILGIIIAAIILAALNLERILGLLGRNASLSGRIPMWTYLLQNAVKQHPILGYGYDAFWNLQGFREQMTPVMGFSLEVSQSDNGFMEILLHLGLVGIIVLFGLIVLGFIRSIKYFRKNRTLTSAFPMILLIYAIIVNTTVSMLLETDSFVWAVVLASQAALNGSVFTIRKKS